MYINTKQKYIIAKRFKEVVIFSDFIEHSRFRGLEPISAGFCYIGHNEVNCFGESISLNLKSDQNDSYLATKQIFGYEAAETLLEKLNKQKSAQ